MFRKTTCSVTSRPHSLSQKKIYMVLYHVGQVSFRVSFTALQPQAKSFVQSGNFCRTKHVERCFCVLDGTMKKPNSTEHELCSDRLVCVSHVATHHLLSDHIWCGLRGAHCLRHENSKNGHSAHTLETSQASSTVCYSQSPEAL